MSSPTEPRVPPDPATSYERAKPEKESPQGTLEGPNPPLHESPDRGAPEGTTGKHTNRPASDSMETSTDKQADSEPGDVKHSMFEEEPTGWDQAPQSISDPERKRQPRTEGKGGVP